MMISRCLLIPLISCAAAAAAAAQSGRASAVWVSPSATVEPGKPLQTAIRMVHDPGWHSYWINPGEAGLPTTVEWKLPPGWKCEGLQVPAPIRFVSGGLAGFGYEGTVLIPVTLIPPEDFTGEARLAATISWLACSEEGCVPGEAELHLDLRAGQYAATDDEADIRQAHDKLPKKSDGLRLDLTEDKGRLILGITHDAGVIPDLSESRVFPATPEVIDARAEPRFTKSGDKWTAEAPLSEFAKKPLRKLTLVLTGGGLQSPLEITWVAHGSSDKGSP